MNNSWLYLYHYTNRKGLEGILRDKYLRATILSRTNDKSEVLHGIELFQQALRKRGVKEEDIQNFLSYCWGFLKENANGIFFTSFSSTYDDYIAKNGLLSQWARYGNYAIKFKKFSIAPSEDYSQSIVGYFKKNGTGQCWYTNETFDNFFNKELSNIESGIANFGDDDKYGANLSSDKRHEVGVKLKELFCDFCQCCFMTKDYGFVEENEIRIAVIGFNEEKIFVSDDKKMYIKIFEEEGVIAEAIEEIIIGPISNKEKERRVVKEMLQKYGINAKVRVSKIPLR